MPRRRAGYRGRATAARYDDAGGRELYVSRGDLGRVGHQAVDAQAVERELDEVVKLAAHRKKQEQLRGLAEFLFFGDFF
jgi:hypothetical protein